MSLSCKNLSSAGGAGSCSRTGFGVEGRVFAYACCKAAHHVTYLLLLLVAISALSQRKMLPKYAIKTATCSTSCKLTLTRPR